MNFNIVTKFPFNDVACYAKKLSRKESPKASRIWDFLTDKSIRDYLNLCYTYLRWADDIVDNPEIPIEDKKKFIEHQKKIIASLYNNNYVKTSSIEEACLIYFAEYAKSSGDLILIDEVKNMIEALRMDVYRLECSGVFSNSDFNYYIELMSKSFFNILCVFAFPKSKYREEFYLGMKFTTIALMIRDLEEDINIGYINIGAEDIDYYKLNINNLKNDRSLSIWLADRINYIFGILYEETALLKYLPLKFRIFTYYSLIYRLPPVVRAKVCNYNLKCISEKNFSNEIKTYLISFFTSINIFLKGFIHSSVFHHQILHSRNNNEPRLSLKETLKIAARFTRKRTVWIWIQSIFYISKKHRKYANLCYAYLRWVDDYVDNPENDKHSKVEFVENQLKLIKDFSNEENANSIFQLNELKFNEEFFLYYYIEYAKQLKNDNLIFEIKRVVNSIRIDVERLFCGGILSKDGLNLYIDCASRPCSNIINYFLFPYKKTVNGNKYIGKFLGYITALRDFTEDLEAGYVNIAKEDIVKYNLNIADFKHDRKRFDWMADKYPELLDLLYEEISVLKSMPVKAKLFWLPPYSVVLTMLIRIKIYNYSFGENVKKEFRKELKVYLQSLSLAVKLYFKTFFEKSTQ